MTHVEIKPFVSLTDAERAARRQIDASVDWGSPNTPEPTWSSADWSVMVWSDGVVVSKLGVLRRDALVGRAPVVLGGVGGVATLPSQQGKGFGSLALAETARFLTDELAVDFGLLVCEFDRVAFYRKNGWWRVGGPLLFDYPQYGKLAWPKAVMILPCRKQDWPGGIIDVCGPPW